MSKTKKGLFTTEDGRNHTFIFFLVALLFTLWAVGNSLIDTMDKHFQDYYHLTKADSANVQFSHYLGYARDGLLPPVFAQVHPKYKTPYISRF